MEQLLFLMEETEAPSKRSHAPVKKLDDLEVGKAAEHLVVADLILKGFRAYLSDQGLPYDVVIDLDGRLLRMQVKATRGLSPIPQRASTTKGYLFQIRRAGKGGKRRYSSKDFDVVALVALDVRAIAYLPFADSLPGCLILRPIGAKAEKNATRLKNIDGFPIEDAVRLLKMADQC